MKAGGHFRSGGEDRREGRFRSQEPREDPTVCGHGESRSDFATGMSSDKPHKAGSGGGRSPACTDASSSQVADRALHRVLRRKVPIGAVGRGADVDWGGRSAFPPNEAGFSKKPPGGRYLPT